jgi:hypothetical protein
MKAARACRITPLRITPNSPALQVALPQVMSKLGVPGEAPAQHRGVG